MVRTLLIALVCLVGDSLPSHSAHAQTVAGPEPTDLANLVDIIGYADNVGILQADRKRAEALTNEPAEIVETRARTTVIGPELTDLTRPADIIGYADNTLNLDPMIAIRKESPFFPSRATTDGMQLSTADFEDAQVCRACHIEIYEQWSHSVMSHAWEDPIYRAVLKRGHQAMGGAVDNFCIGCHSPIGLTTSTTTAIDDEPVAVEGVSCEVCHNISGVVGLGNGAYVLTPKKYGRPLKFGPRRDAKSPYHDTAYSELHTKSAFCATCHNVTHPFNRLPIERTYDEWRDSIYNSAGIECQDCHMTPNSGVTQNPGKSATMGPERSHIYSHMFTGANETLHNYYGESEMVERVQALHRSAATIEFADVPEAFIAGEIATLQVKVTNVGAGHKLPTGFPEGREVWVDFKVHDEKGNEIYRLGAIRDGRTEKGTKSFKVTLGDPDGNVVDINVWEADRVLSDTRVLPMSSTPVKYMFRVPAGVDGSLSIVADLNYWSFPQAIVDELLGEGALEVQISRMASVERLVKVAPRPSKKTE